MNRIISFFILLYSVCQLHAQTRLRERLDSMMRTRSPEEELYFASLYRLCTNGIQEMRINDPSLHNGFIDELSKSFGDYFFEATRQKDLYLNQQHLSWQLALDSQQGEARFLKALLLGVNAHINRDLAYALKDVLSHYHKDSIPALKEDYNKLFGVIAATSEQIYPALIAADSLHGLNRWIMSAAGRSVKHKIDRWRKQAWKTAIKCIEEPERADLILSKHARYAEKLAVKIYYEKGKYGWGLKKFSKLDKLSRKEKIALISNLPAETGINSQR